MTVSGDIKVSLTWVGIISCKESPHPHLKNIWKNSGSWIEYVWFDAKTQNYNTSTFYIIFHILHEYISLQFTWISIQSQIF